jgi:DNA-binding XRE family transcriptional regulator
MSDELDTLLATSLLPRPHCAEGTFPYLLTRARQANGWTKKDLAARAGLSPPTVGNFERGTWGPSLAALVRLSDVFGWGALKLGEMARLAAAYPWKTRGDYPSRAGAGSVKKRLRAHAEAR